jgi:group II intron reverse transcriptase/maturase
MSVDELLPYLKEHSNELVEQIRDGKYKPNPVRRVEIPKEEKGKVRKLGIPTVVDRVIQQAIAGVLTPIYEPQFSENSFGFRPNKSAHDALKRCKENVDDGYEYVVDMDLEKFFDTVCQSKLIEVLSHSIKDGRVISLIHKYLNAGVVQNGLFEKTLVGVPQGGPLSPVLSNIMLNELDKELACRGHRFVRYADDCMIFCRSKKSAERTLQNIVPFIEGKLFLKVNREKTVIAHVNSVKFLGYAFYQYKGECRFRVHPKSVKKMQNRIRELMKRSNGWGNDFRREKLRQFITGWINYFKLADMKKLLHATDEWLRRKIRAVYWKQWKKVKTRYRMIEKFGLPKWKVHEMANCRKGIWRASIMLNSVLTNKEIANLGFMFMTGYYLKCSENLGTAVYRTVRTVV